MGNLLNLLLSRSDLPDTSFSELGVQEWPSRFREFVKSHRLLEQAEWADVVECTACDKGHFEELLHRPAGPNGEFGAYIRCPENGFVVVKQEELLRYKFSPSRFATLAADVLRARGSITNLVPGRVWNLGRCLVGDTFRDVFLVHGLRWKDGPTIVRQCSALETAQGAVVVTTGQPPSSGLWQHSPPVIIPAAVLFSCDHEGMACDEDYLASRVGVVPKAVPTAQSSSVDPPADAQWQDISIHIGDQEMRVTHGQRRWELTAKEAGFGDGRSQDNKPDAAWRLLQIMARVGEIPTGSTYVDGESIPNVKSTVTQLRKQLKVLCAIDDDPFHPTRPSKVYAPKFTLQTMEPVALFLPDGTSWEVVTITAIGEEYLHIVFDEIVLQAGWESYGEESHRIAIHAVEDSYHTVTFRELGLLTAKGSLTRTGQALLQILRSDGGVVPDLDDLAATEVNALLRKLFQADSDPLDYSEINGWKCRFEVGSRS